MDLALPPTVDSLLDFFTPLDDARRLYRLEGEGEVTKLKVQAWSQREGLSEPYDLEILCHTRSGTMWSTATLLSGGLMRVHHETLIGEDAPSLEQVMPLTGLPGAVFDRSKDRTANVHRTLELLAWRDGYSFNLQINTRDGKVSPTLRVRPGAF